MGGGGAGVSPWTRWMMVGAGADVAAQPASNNPANNQPAILNLALLLLPLRFINLLHLVTN